MSFEEKYLKYKKKYFTLINNQTGGTPITNMNRGTINQALEYLSNSKTSKQDRREAREILSKYLDEIKELIAQPLTEPTTTTVESDTTKLVAELAASKAETAAVKIQLEQKKKVQADAQLLNVKTQLDKALAETAAADAATVAAKAEITTAVKAAVAAAKAEAAIEAEAAVAAAKAETATTNAATVAAAKAEAVIEAEATVAAAKAETATANAATVAAKAETTTALAAAKAEARLTVAAVAAATAAKAEAAAAEGKATKSDKAANLAKLDQKITRGYARTLVTALNKATDDKKQALATLETIIAEATAATLVSSISTSALYELKERLDKITTESTCFIQESKEKEEATRLELIEAKRLIDERIENDSELDTCNLRQTERIHQLELENKDLRERLYELEQSKITLSPPIQRKQVLQQDSKKLIKVEYDHLNRDINEMSKMVISGFSKLRR